MKVLCPTLPQPLIGNFVFVVLIFTIIKIKGQDHNPFNKTSLLFVPWLA